jgi:hypothetical protein
VAGWGPLGKGRTLRCVDDDSIRALLKRLARPHPSGGKVVERAAILADGADFDAVMAWVVAHGGTPETAVRAAPSHGLHGPRMTEGAGTAGGTPSRFILPPDAFELDSPPATPDLR